MATDFTKGMSANHRIKRILKSYQQTAERSLNGPREDGAPVAAAVYRGGAAMPRSEGTCRGARQIVSRDRGPAGRDRDQAGWKRSEQALGPGDAAEGSRGPGGKCEIVETVLEGERIACFEVGGEQRLCMPQILSTVLCDFDPAEVFGVCEELHIFFSRCDPIQLGTLIRAKILPQKVATCGLITYTNAERMCSTLLRNQSAHKYRLPVTIEGLKVHHECFGGCNGVFVPEAFEFPTAKCVQCAECGEMFAPAQFVSHSHSELENGTIHWGFNPTHWKSYLMLSTEQSGYPRIQELLDSLKGKFDDSAYEKMDKTSIKQEVDDVMPVKRIRYERPVAAADAAAAASSPAESSPLLKWEPADVSGAWKFCIGLCKQLDSIKIRSDAKFPAFLQTEPPFLADSERVVPYTDSQWSDKSCAPNVSLDPSPYKNLHDMYDDDCDEDEPIDDVDAAAMTQSCRRSKSMTSCDVSLVASHASNSGDVSDDDSESVLSDKLPVNDDEDQTADQMSSLRNAHLGLLIRALEGELHWAAKEESLKEFVQLQEQHSDVVESLADNNNALSQRRLYLWTVMEDRLRSMEEIRRNQDEELASLRQESSMKLKEAMIERRRLIERIERLSNGSVDSDLAIQVTNYKQEAEMLRKKLQNAEEVNSSLRREISELHRAIESLAQTPEHGIFVPLVVQPEVTSHAARSGMLPPAFTLPPSMSVVHLQDA